MLRFTAVLCLSAASALAQSRPTIDALNPASTPVGTPNFVLTLTGSNYTADSRIVWRYGTLAAVTLPTAFQPPNQLSAPVAPGLLAEAGDVVIAVTRQLDNQVLVSNLASFGVTGGFAIQTPCPLPNAVVNTPYIATLSAAGGAPPYLWSLATGVLPAGLAISAAGSIGGTPALIGESSFVLRAVDAVGRTAQLPCSLRVLAAQEGQTLFITSIAPNGIAAGAPETRIEIRGLGFQAGVSAVWIRPAGDQTDLATTLLNPGLLTAIVPAALLAAPGSATIAVKQVVLTRTVFSNSEVFTVSSALTTAGPCPLIDGGLNTAYSIRLGAQGGFPPYRFVVVQGALPAALTLSPDGLVSGTATEAGGFQFTYSVTDSRGNVATRACSLRIIGPLEVSPTAITLTAPSGGQPVAQDISAITAAAGAAFTPSASTQFGGAWLRVTANGPRTPALARVTADPSSLPPGLFRGQIAIDTTDATNRTLSIPVTFTVTAAEPARLAAVPASMRFVASRDFRALPGQGLLVTNTSGSAIGFNASSTAPWLSVSPTSGAPTGAAPTPLVVRVDAAALDAGTYRGEIVLASGASRTAIPVTLAISPGPQVLRLSRSAVTFTAAAGGPKPSAKQLHVLGAASPYFWEAAPDVNSPGRWLADPAVSASNPGEAAPLDISVDPLSLPAGVHQTEIRVAAQAADNSPGYITASLEILAANAVPAPRPEPASLVFTSAAGLSPAPQQLLLRNLSRTPMSMDVQLAGDTRYWTIDTGSPRSVPPGEARPIGIGLTSADATPGTYRATLAVQGSGSPLVQLVDLVLIVTPPSGCLVNRLEIAPLSLPTNFTATGGLAADLDFSIRDNCGQPFTAANGVVSVSANTAPAFHASLTNLRDGRWVGTWPVGRTEPGPVRLSVTAAGGTVSGAFSLQGNVAANAAQPVLFPEGSVSLASFAQTPLAPGSLAASFGAGLAAATQAAAAFPLPIRLAGASMLLGDRELPLYFASPGQINFQLPYGLSPHVPQQLAVRSGDRISNRVEIIVAPAQPSLFAVTDEFNALVSAANPTQSGKVVVIYCEGLGETNPAAQAGAVVGSSPLSAATLPVTVAIGGRNAGVLFAGLTPGLAGLYQINAVVPDGIAAGDSVEVAVTSNRFPGNTLRIAVR